MLDERRRKFLNDKHRPIYHFLPPQNWMNDPNGLIQWNGKYHLFYQHNPYDAVWGNMTWGHAISDDLIHWQDMPLAIERTPNTYDANGIFSGCAVDNNGVATVLYTGTTGERNELQTICVATSHDDDLRTWQKYEGNPVLLAPPEGFKAKDCFRDPYVWREGDTWYMVLGAGRPNGSEGVLLYRSLDLYQWEYLHPLIESTAQNDNIYECPNFFPLGNKWVLLVSVMPVSHVEYFIGTFENLYFTPEQHGRFVDGTFFAPLSFLDGSGRRLLMGWIPEQRPIEGHQAAGWAGVMSLPVKLSLAPDSKLLQTPISDFVSDMKIPDWEFSNVTESSLTEIQSEIGELALKVEIGDNGITAYIDHSVIEVFDDDKHSIRRIYDNMGLPSLNEFVTFPIQQIQIWKVETIW
jgi:beta-fructofuranosidase